MYPEPIRNTPKLHQDSRGVPVTPGDWLADSLNPSLQPLQVVRLHGAGQFVYLSETTGEELTSFCCCFTICPPPAPQGPSDSLAAPAAAGQGVGTRKTPAEKLQDLREEFSGSCTLPEPDFVLIRARDLEHVLMMWTRSIEMREKGGAWRHTEKTALGLLRNRANSAQSLGSFVADLIAEARASA